MSKNVWATPKLEVLSTRKTAAGGSLVEDSFHDGLSNTNFQLTLETDPGTS